MRMMIIVVDHHCILLKPSKCRERKRDVRHGMLRCFLCYYYLFFLLFIYYLTGVTTTRSSSFGVIDRCSRSKIVSSLLRWYDMNTRKYNRKCLTMTDDVFLN